MAVPSATNVDNKTPTSANGLTPEQKEGMVAAAGRHKDNPDYIKSGQEQVAEYRRQLQKEFRGFDTEEEQTTMSTATEVLETQNAETDRSIAMPPVGMSDAEFADILTHIERRKNKPGYFERWDAQVAEYRQQVQEQAERELAAEGK